MRRTMCLLLVLLLLVPSPVWAAMALVGSQSNCVSGNLFAGTSSYVYNYPAALTNGSLAIITVGTDIRTVSSIAGTATTYTINGVNTNNATAGFNNSLWKAIAAGSDTTTTITLSGTTADFAFVCFALFSGNDSDQSGSVANGASFDAATAHNSGSVTPPTANNVVVAAMRRTAGTWTEDAAFTHVSAANADFYFGYRVQTSATAQESNQTSVDAEYSAMRIGAFAGTADAGTVNFFPRRLQVQP